MDIENDEDEFSLAMLADIDVSEIEEIRFESLPAGAFEFEVTKAELVEAKNKDDERRIIAQFDFKVVAVKAVLKPGIDKEGLVGKTHSEKHYINPAAPQEDTLKAIGRIRAFVTDMGGDSTGKLGPMLENLKGHIFPGKIKEKADKEDKSIVYARMALDSKATKK